MTGAAAGAKQRDVKAMQRNHGRYRTSTKINRIMNRWVFLLSLLALSSCLWAQGSLADRVQEFATRPELRGAQIGIDVIDVQSGSRIAAFQPYNSLIPASTLKLITTAAAYDILGPEHRFATELAIAGKVIDGTLKGDVYILGGGDPTLASPYMDGVPRLPALLDRWSSALNKAGIQRIEGRIIGDGSYFGTDGAAAGWPWADLGNYYGAGAYGLNIHENSYSLDLLQRNTLGSPPIIQGTRPAIGGLTITNELVSGPKGSGDQAYIYAAPFGDKAYVRGSIPVGSKRFTIRGSIPDPPLYAAQALMDHLIGKGFAVSLPAESDRTVGGGRYRTTEILDRYLSPPLTEIIDRTNLRSLNLYAEALLREVGKAKGKELKDLSGTAAIQDWLQALNLDTAPINLVDGSGLATRNFFSPDLMTSFLRSQAGNLRWRQSIPLAGKTGSMKGYLRKRTAEGRLYAKSGSLSAARCYAGYATGRADGRELAFAIMVNNHTLGGRELRNLMLELMNHLCEDKLR